MEPRHFWWLAEEDPPAGKLSEADKDEILDWLHGNDNGGF